MLGIGPFLLTDGNTGRKSEQNYHASREIEISLGHLMDRDISMLGTPAAQSGIIRYDFCWCFLGPPIMTIS
jgi:hypothetical protein